MRHNDNSIPVDDVAELDEVYLPFYVTYQNIENGQQLFLLIFATCASIAADLADQFLETNGIEGIVINVNLMGVQATIVQRDEPCPENHPDELDDELRTLNWQSKK